jgi:hypothetical protein
VHSRRKRGLWELTLPRQRKSLKALRTSGSDSSECFSSVKSWPKCDLHESLPASDPEFPVSEVSRISGIHELFMEDYSFDNCRISSRSAVALRRFSKVARASSEVFPGVVSVIFRICFDRRPSCSHSCRALLHCSDRRVLSCHYCTHLPEGAWTSAPAQNSPSRA